MKEWVVAFLLLSGSTFMLLAALGVFRMPDVFSRLHCATKASSLGLLCTLSALALDFMRVDVTARSILTISFVFLTAPIAAHAIGRAAHLVTEPRPRTVTDEMPEEPSDR